MYMTLGKRPQGEWALAVHWVFTLTEQCHSCFLFWKYFAFSLFSLSVGWCWIQTMPAPGCTHWIHSPWTDKLDGSSGKATHQEWWRKMESTQQGLLLFFAIKTKLAFLSTFLSVISLVNHWLAGQTNVGDQSRFQCVFLYHQSCCRLLWETLGLAHPPSLKVCCLQWKAVNVVS